MTASPGRMTFNEFPGRTLEEIRYAHFSLHLPANDINVIMVLKNYYIFNCFQPLPFIKFSTPPFILTPKLFGTRVYPIFIYTLCKLASDLQYSPGGHQLTHASTEKSGWIIFRIRIINPLLKATSTH